MANAITVTGIPANNYVDVTSRYIGLNVLYYGDRNLVTFETYKRTPITFSADDKFMVIPKSAEYRPDLIAYKVYGLASLWWKIMEANGLYDIWDFKAGVNIRIPNTFF